MSIIERRTTKYNKLILYCQNKHLALIFQLSAKIPVFFYPYQILIRFCVVQTGGKKVDFINVWGLT